MKSKVIYDASENVTNEGNAVNQESGLSEKDIVKFKRKMNRLLTVGKTSSCCSARTA